MELKEFVKNVLGDLVEAVEEARTNAVRDMELSMSKENRTVEFDIAVTAEDSIKGGGRAGIRVLQFIEGGGEISSEVKNATVSRVKFGINISQLTKDERYRLDTQIQAQFKKNNFNKER